jgi:hypothetical protein
MLDGDRLIRLATEIVMMLSREAGREGIKHPSGLDFLTESVALEYVESFYHEVYLVEGFNGVRADRVKVRKFMEKWMAETEDGEGE